MVRRGYAVAILDLIHNPVLPESLDVLLIAGPATGLTSTEADTVLAFLDRGGSVLALLDPIHPVTLAPILDRAGVEFLPHVLSDPDHPDPEVISPRPASNHPVVRSLSQKRS